MKEEVCQVENSKCNVVVPSSQSQPYLSIKIHNLEVALVLEEVTSQIHGKYNNHPISNHLVMSTKDKEVWPTPLEMDNNARESS